MPSDPVAAQEDSSPPASPTIHIDLTQVCIHE
jgi:hypothetical protein